MSAEDTEVANTGTGENRVAIRVIEELARTQGVDPLDLPPLFERIDLEALDDFVTSADSDATVVVSIDGHRVTITGGGDVTAG